MKKNLFFVLFTVIAIVFSSCSNDDDDKDDVKLTKSDLVGTWNVSSYAASGNFEDVPSGYIYIKVNNDNTYRVKFLTNTYSGTYVIDGNTMVGTTLDPITEYFKFDKLEDSKAEISYSTSDGQRYKFKASK